MSSSIQVAIKVRPLIRREEEENLPIQWTVQDKCIAPLDPELKKRGEGGFYFDHIFGMDTTNIDVFDTIAKPIVEAAVNGFNGTIFAYGQTSSGKTYTMMGTRDVPGVIPLSVDHIFGLIQQSDRQFLLRVSYTEIYNERVNDLLNPEGIDLKIKEDVKGQAFVKCKEELVNSPEQVLVIVKKGDKNRRIGETNMNERSSRSHTILRITIESREANDETGAIQVSQLNLVDLAGSERAAQTGASGTRFKEGTHINMSLSALGLVIMQLSEAQENSKIFVNFRDSKLTRILQPSLGGNAMTTIICAVTPAALEETQCTLAFASRAKRIKNKPKLNEELSDAALLKRYAKQLSKLEAELKNVQSADVVEMASKLLEKERANQILEERIELLKKSILCGNSRPDKQDSFKTEAKRRRTWGGGGALVSKNPIFQNAIGLPTIVESDRTPEKKKEQFKQHSKRRQSIIQQIDIASEPFQTEFADFELELIECEKARADGRLSDVSTTSDDDNFITRRPQRTVKFMDDVSVFSSTGRSSDAAGEPKSPEQCNAEPELPETPKVALRRRISFLMEQYNSLNEENGNLVEFTKLERQMIVDEEVEKAMAEHNKKLATSEQMFSELNDKYTKLQIHSAETDRLLAGSNDRLSELERQMAESISSLRALKREKQALVDELNKHKGENQTSETLLDNKEEKEISSIFENASYFEDMNVSDVQADSVFSNDTQNAQDLTMFESNVANMTANTTVTSDVREVKLLAEKLSETVQLLTAENAELTNKLANDKECANQNEKHLQETISELLSKIHAITETVQQLTTENAELTSKLANDKECANQNEKHLQETISELLSKIHAITEEKNLLKNSMWELEQRLQKSEADAPTSTTEDETAKSIENYKATIASLTAENIELSSNLMNKIEELDRVKDLKSPPGDHECAYRELSVNLSERNKLLENENIELSNNLMEKIEEYDRLKEDLEALNRRSESSLAQENSNNLVEISMNRSNLIEKEQSDRASAEIVDDLLQLSVVESELNRHTNKNGHTDEPRVEKTERSNGSEIGGPTIDELLQMSIVSNGKTRESLSNDNSSNEDIGSWKIKAEMLIEQVKSLQQLNEKLKDLKRTTCKQCSYLTDLNENRRALKAETKEMNRKLEKLQEKFDRECADSEILRTKANEDLNLTVCDSTLNDSTMLDGSFSVSVLEDRVQRLRYELDTLKEKYGKLSDDYNEKCDEIEKLQDASSRETTPTPSSTDSPRVKRRDNKFNKIETEMESLKTDLRRLKKGLATVGAGLQKYSNEKTTMSNEIESLRAEKLELQKKFAGSEDSSIARESIETLGKEVDRLRREIEIVNVAKEDLENAKASLEAEVRALKSGNSFVEKLTETEDSAIAKERIKSLEIEVSRLSAEVNASNAVKEELRNAKSALEAEVRALKTGNSLVEKLTETENSSIAAERIKSLEIEVSRLSTEVDASNAVKEELRNAKSALEGEVRALKTGNAFVEKFTETEDSSIAAERIKSLEIEISRLSQELKASNAVKEELRNTNTALETEVHSLKITNESFEVKIADMKNSSADLERIASLEKDLARLTEELESSNAVKAELQTAKLSLVAEVHSLKTEKESLEAKSTDSEDTSIPEEKIKRLENDLARLSEEIDISNNTKEELESVKTSLEIEVRSLKVAKESLEEKLGLMEIEVARLNEQMSDSNIAERELENAKSLLDAEVRSLLAANESLEEKLGRMEIDVARLNEEIADSNIAERELEKAKSLLDAKVLSLRAAKESLESRFAESEHSSLAEETIEQLRNEVARLNELVGKNREQRNAESPFVAQVELALTRQSVIEAGTTEFIRSVRNAEDNNSDLALESESASFADDEIVDSPNMNGYDKTLESLKSKLSESTCDVRNYIENNAERNGHLAKMSTAGTELNDAESELKDVANNLKKLLAENASLKKKLMEFEASEEELTNSKLLLNNEVTSLRAEITKLESNLSVQNQRLRDLEEKNVLLNNELESVRWEKTEKSGKEFPEDSPYETLKEYEIMVEELKTKVQEVNDDLHVNARETLELNEQLAKLSAAKEEFNDIRLALESEVTMLKSERADIEETLTALRQSLEKLEAKNSFLSAELETMRAEKETIVASKIDSGEPAEKSDSPKREKSDSTKREKSDSHTQEKSIEALNGLVRELTIELDRYAAENAELIAKVSELQEKLKNQAQKSTEINSLEKEEKLRSEVNAARDCITKEIKSLKPTSERQDLIEKSVSELFGVFVHEIMSKEKEIIKMLTASFEERRRKLEESARQSVDAEKRANVWARELEAEIERTQQDLYRQEAKNTELNSEISKLKNLLLESSHENQMLKEKMDVLELDFNTLHADLENRSGGKQNTTLNTTQQEKERLIEEALATREMELSSKLRLAEKQYREKLEELTNSLESYKMKNLELANNLEGFEVNEKQLRSIVDMKSSELVKCNNRIESMQSELEHLTERHNRLSRDHDEKSRQVDEITSLLKSKCDKLSEYKTKLETITPEYEHLKDQAAERKVRLEKYRDEIECMTTENEKRVESLKDKLVSEEIKSAGYRKQLADLTNRNTALQMELDELRTKCEELEHANGKLTRSLRNSTSKVRAAEEMENLLDSNRTLQRNLDGAANRIAELQEMRTQTMKELVELRGTYEIVCNENREMRNTLSTHRSSVNDAIELRGKYELLLQEKNRVALELEDKKSMLVMLERKLENCERENEELKSTNRELDEEMEDMVEKISELTKENAELDDKLYAMRAQTSGGDQPKSNEYESKIEEFKSHVDRLRGELAAALKTSECLKNENSELRIKVAYRERTDSLSGDSSRSGSPALEMEAARIDNRRRRSRTELFNQKRQLEVFEENGTFPWGEGCRCVALEKKVRELEHELVSKNGQVAALEIRIQSENFPYMKKAKDLEEMLGSAKRKIKTLEVELVKLREFKNIEISSECKRCKQWENNKRDNFSQCMPETNSKICMNGISSGTIDEHIKMTKLEKTIDTLKTVSRNRQKNILELEKKNAELERRVKELETISSPINLREDAQLETSTSFPRSTSSRSDSARAMKENLPMVQEVQRPATHLRRNWFN